MGEQDSGKTGPPILGTKIERILGKKNGSGFREKFGRGFREKIWAGGRENKTRGFKPHFLRPLLLRFEYTLLGTVRPKTAQQPCAVRRHVIPFRECLALGTQCHWHVSWCALRLWPRSCFGPCSGSCFAFLLSGLCFGSCLAFDFSSWRQQSTRPPPLPELAFNAPARL